MYGKNAWLDFSAKDLREVESFGEDYRSFISKNKTEREIVTSGVKLLEDKEFKPIESFASLKAGDKVYFINKNKNILAYIIGERPLIDGLRILGAHIDSPRMDLKQNPLYESKEFALLNTHYYGGIKKYQWVTIPLALHGVVVKKDGSKVLVTIGEDDDDPVLGISDLLIHLSADQMQKTAAKVIEGENLDVTFGNIPLKGEDKDAVKVNILKLLKKKYGFDEEDFISSEIEVVPAGRARDYGFDRSMIAGYGHDDRSCAYTSLRAILDITEVPTYTSCCLLVDKEEAGSIGATGAQSRFFLETVDKLLFVKGEYSPVALDETLKNSRMLSSDVSAGFDPLFPEVNDAQNACYLGHGIVFNKYTGARGKSGCNDANPEFIARIRSVLDKDEVHYQTSELGKVDQGGGGTIAYIFGNLDMNVLDAGIPVLNMHSPMEIVSKADVYEAYRAYKSFLLG
jgi:aspartyl aminopeptidase